jgi:hypothetical protein
MAPTIVIRGTAAWAAWGGLLAAGLLAACGSSSDDDAVGKADLSAPPSSAESGGLAASASDAAYGTADGLSAPTDVAEGDPVDEGAPFLSPVDAPPPPAVIGDAQAGTLTAGTWDDNRNLDRFLDYRTELESEQLQGLPDFTEEEQRDAAERATERPSHAKLDVALVIDTTGSMGDELTYLQTEFDALSSAIEAAYPGAEQRWALVVYRDEGDVYVTNSFDFEASAATFRGQLQAQSAENGGDFPEAPDAALEAMNQLAWRSEPDVARLAFWVADAPHHVEKTAAFSGAVEVAAGQDVHLYPVASSGVDELTEYSMRSAAQLTLGRYLFLTNDSGVGGDHKEPSIPCYFVTRLNDAILRMVDIEMSGVYHEPTAEQVLRTGGNPTDGACSLQSGQIVFAF